LIRGLCGGLGTIGLAGMFADEQARAEPVIHKVGPHFQPPPSTTSSCSWWRTLAVGHVRPKPALAKYAGQRPPSTQASVPSGSLADSCPRLSSSRKYGQSGIEVSDLLPNLAKSIDDICVIRSMYTFNPTHTPARNLFHSGISRRRGRQWERGFSYGLGSENQNLPGFVVLSPGGE